MAGDAKLIAFLRRLSRGAATFEDAGRRILRFDDGTMLRRHSVDSEILRRVLSEGLAATAGATLALTAAGRARLTMLSDERRDGSTEPLAQGDGVDAVSPLIDIAESPLAWLYRRRGNGGRGVISEAEFLAGERLRGDFTKAGMMPSVTTNWRALAAPGGGGVSRADLADFALAARDRVQAALTAIGPELSDVALDVCCFLKGLEQVESERAWPQRSAKVALQLALKALARHYGLSSETSGQRSSTGLRHWGTADFRPTLGRQ